jgi:hypothetical protein
LHRSASPDSYHSFKVTSASLLLHERVPLNSSSFGWIFLLHPKSATSFFSQQVFKRFQVFNVANAAHASNIPNGLAAYLLFTSNRLIGECQGHSRISESFLPALKMHIHHSTQIVRFNPTINVYQSAYLLNPQQIYPAFLMQARTCIRAKMSGPCISMQNQRRMIRLHGCSKRDEPHLLDQPPHGDDPRDVPPKHTPRILSTPTYLYITRVL